MSILLLFKVQCRVLRFQTMVHNALNAQSTTVSNAKALKYAQNVKVDTTFNLIL